MKSVPKIKKHKDVVPFGNSAGRKEAFSEWLLFWIIFIPIDGVGFLEKYRIWHQEDWGLNSNPAT